MPLLLRKDFVMVFLVISTKANANKILKIFCPTCSRSIRKFMTIALLALF